MITFLKGDIFESTAMALVNPVNTVGTMGKGLAKEFAIRFPHNLDVYKRACFTAKIAPGNPLFVVDKLNFEQKIVVNFPTKVYWAEPSQMKYIRTGLETLAIEIERRGILSIAIPAIGCGLGQLQWARVRKEIVDRLSHLENVQIYVYEPK